MNDLIPQQGLFPSRIDRLASRQLQSLRANTTLAAARENARAEIVAEVTETSLVAAAHVSAIEELLARRTPSSEGRLRHIADAGCLALGEIVIKAGRRVS